MRPYASVPTMPDMLALPLEADPDPFDRLSPIGTEGGTAGGSAGIEADTVDTEDALCNSTCLVVWKQAKMRLPYGIKTLLTCRKTPSVVMECVAPYLVVQLVRISLAAE